MSIYTPPPPDHHAVLEGVTRFRESNPVGTAAYADVHSWSRSCIEDPTADPRFLEADIGALADAIAMALSRDQQRAESKEWRTRKARGPRPTTPPPSSVDAR